MLPFAYLRTYIFHSGETDSHPAGMHHMTLSVMLLEAIIRFDKSYTYSSPPPPLSTPTEVTMDDSIDINTKNCSHSCMLY